MEEMIKGITCILIGLNVIALILFGIKWRRNLMMERSPNYETKYKKSEASKQMFLSFLRTMLMLIIAYLATDWLNDQSQSLLGSSTKPVLLLLLFVYTGWSTIELVQSRKKMKLEAEIEKEIDKKLNQMNDKNKNIRG